MKVAFITGCNGQDGSYLVELLLNKGYKVHGLIRRTSSLANTYRLNEVYNNPNFELHYGDLTDSICLVNLIEKIQPDEVYNLAAMSHVKVSFEIPEYTGNVDAIGTLRLLEACRKINKKIRFYQASTSEMFGGIHNISQNEDTPFHPRSPYGVAKLYSHYIVKNYREAYDMFAVNGILFNHTSPRRGETFVEQKIVKAAIAIKNKKQDCLYLGNIYSKRDIGHSSDYVYAMWLMLQNDNPVDYVVATGKTYLIKDIVNKVFNILNMSLIWKGEKENETASFNGEIVVKIDPKYYRPSEVDFLVGDSTKIRKELGWKPKYEIKDILEEMINNS